MVNDSPPRFVRILGQIAELRRGLDDLEYEVVQFLRDAGVSWTAIGDELDMSRQNARRRFTRPRRRRVAGQPPSSS